MSTGIEWTDAIWSKRGGIHMAGIIVSPALDAELALAHEWGQL